MSQNYKAVYFSDFPADKSKQKSVTLAFGQRSGDLYRYVKDLSSAEIRLLLGTESYKELVATAQAEDLPLNAFCLRRLKKALARVQEQRVQYTLPGMESQQQLFDPLTVTFRGEAKEPFVRWYPFLEGYSPQYVQSILSRYAPHAKAVLDPFVGTGTTAFVAAQLDKRAYFCEINPVLQFVCLVKIRVRRMGACQRTDLVEALTQASTARPKSFGGLGRQWTASVCPFERLGHRAVEIVDELQNTLP